MFKPFFKLQTDKHAETEQVLELLKDSGYAKQLRLEQDVARIAKQKAPIPKLKDLRQQREKKLPEVRANLAAAEAEEQKREAALEEARHKRIVLAGEESNLSFWFDQQEEKLLTEIKSLAPACIDAFISELWQLETETRNSVCCEVRDTRKNFATDQYGHRFESNIKAVETRVTAIRTARKQAEELKLEAIPEAEIIARLDKLKADLPSADEFEVTTIPVPDPAELRRGA